MNKQDREQLAKYIKRLENLKAQVAAVGEELRTMADAAESLGEAADACEEGNVGEATEALESLRA